MPNKCTHCGTVHPDDATYLLSGCSQCGSKFFFYVRQDVLERIEKEVEEITQDQIKEIEQDVREIAGVEDETVILDLEAIRVVQPGKYKIDVTTLFNQRPLVIRTGEGKYKLDLSTISRQKDRKTPAPQSEEKDE
ncbi:MAG: zinc-ribbon domain-containing protein [Candidatus Aenigmarchaeota archaeon]|nr:zinc-ribbon domain-containing protein [Candidatus Aenigmarchaeota archaeon]